MMTNYTDNPPSRRHITQAMGFMAIGTMAATGATFTPKSLAATDDRVSLTGPYLDLTTPRGNMIGAVRIWGNLKPVTKHGYYKGWLFAIKPDQKVETIMGFEGFSSCRMIEQEDGTYQRLNREVGYYTDLKTGEIMEEWYNPYIDETVKIIPIANDPYNMKFQETFPRPPSQGGMNREAYEPRPLQLDWDVDGDALYLNQNVHLYHKNALDPETWPQESTGEYMQASELFQFLLSLKDMQNPELTSLPARGNWVRIAPWLPWMLMGQREGHLLYKARIARYDSLDRIPEHIVEYTEKNYPKFTEAPTEWVEPAQMSSFERYAIEQTPKPLNE